ncbi:MAG: folate-binding protein [Alphaproteobacteria bacterium]|jgi:folate-binding protein YgfZ|nr:folate-binding protein [Alphaproteobacteria bacterium]NDA90401.1 folate-binding protein [Alphaproteobacteria bacterium]NDE19356.1 folate-binding protein [Alphaproteobacteria bacterium]
MPELLENRSILSLSGKDALVFLQNIVTNDLNNYSYSYNYLLSPQGRYLYDFFVLKLSPDQLFIDIDSISAQSFLQKLTIYKLRRDIEIKNLASEYLVLYSREKMEINEGVIASNCDPRFSKLGFRSIVQSSCANKLELVGNNLYMQDKYEFTIPDGRDDLIAGNSVVFQFGAEELAAVSFSKGCYIGQEVISRAKYQGITRKKLFKLVSDKKIAFNDIGTEITDLRGEKIGIFCSSYNKLGIGLLNEEKYLGLDTKIALINGIQEVLILKPEWR